MKWIGVGLVYTVVVTLLLLVFQPRAEGPLETKGKSVDDVVAEVEDRASSLTANPLGWLLTSDGGLDDQVRKMRSMAKKAETPEEQHEALEQAALVDKWVYMRIKPLYVVVPIIGAGMLFACFGMLGIWAGAPKNGTTGLLMGCAAPLVSQQIPSLVLTAPLLVIGVVHLVAGGRRFDRGGPGVGPLPGPMGPPPGPGAGPTAGGGPPGVPVPPSPGTTPPGGVA